MKRMRGGEVGRRKRLEEERTRSGEEKERRTGVEVGGEGEEKRRG